jgi:hypothetical protein
MSINRYGAIKRLNKSNFIALLSSCNEDTLRNIFPVRKHDLLKLISDRLTKQELQDIVYNLHEIDTQAIISQHDIRLQQIALLCLGILIGNLQKEVKKQAHLF